MAHGPSPVMITGNPRLRQVRKTQIMPFRDFTAISEDVLEKIVRHLFLQDILSFAH